MVANRCKRSQIVTKGRKWSQTVENGFKWSQTVANGLKRSQMVVNGHKLCMEKCLGIESRGNGQIYHMVLFQQWFEENHVKIYIKCYQLKSHV